MNSTVYLKNSDVISRQVAGEIILVPIRGNIANMQHIFTLTPVAEHIWEQIDGKTTVAQLIESICREFEVDAETAENDCLEYLQSLEKSGLIHESK